MYILLNRGIDEEALAEFIDKVNSCEDKKNIKVYLSSCGGDCDVVPVIRNIIEKHQIELIAFSDVHSSALDLFLTTNTPRTVMDETVGLFHRTIIRATLDNNLKPLKEKKLLKIWQKEIKVVSLVVEFLGITDKQLKKVSKGKDLYFNDEELREALKKSEKYFKKN